MLPATATAYYSQRIPLIYALGRLFQLLARRSAVRTSPALSQTDGENLLLHQCAQSLRHIHSSRDELGVIVRAHIHIDHLLFAYANLKAPKKYNNSRPRPDYWKLITITISRGLPKELARPLRKLGFLRNEFAHEFGKTLTAKDIDELWDKLPPQLQHYLQTKHGVGIRNQTALNQYQKIVAAMDVALMACITSVTKTTGEET